MPDDSSTFNPPRTEVMGLLILKIEGVGIKGVEIIEVPTIRPLPDFPTTVIKISNPFNTTTNSPVFCMPTIKVISNTLFAGNWNLFLLPITR